MKGMASEVGGWEDVKGKRTERPRAHTAKWRKRVRKAIYGHTVHGLEAHAETNTQGPEEPSVTRASERRLGRGAGLEARRPAWNSQLPPKRDV